MIAWINSGFFNYSVCARNGTGARPARNSVVLRTLPLVIRLLEHVVERGVCAFSVFFEHRQLRLRRRVSGPHRPQTDLAFSSPNRSSAVERVGVCSGPELHRQVLRRLPRCKRIFDAFSLKEIVERVTPSSGVELSSSSAPSSSANGSSTLPRTGRPARQARRRLLRPELVSVLDESFGPFGRFFTPSSSRRTRSRDQRFSSTAGSSSMKMGSSSKSSSFQESRFAGNMRSSIAIIAGGSHPITSPYFRRSDRRRGGMPPTPCSSRSLACPNRFGRRQDVSLFLIVAADLSVSVPGLCTIRTSLPQI